MTRGTTGWDALIAASGLDRLDARALAEQVSQRPRTWLLAHGDESVPPEQVQLFQSLCARRAAGEPLAYLTGWREFMGHRFDVGPQVLVPRPETEHLVEAAIALGDDSLGAAIASGDERLKAAQALRNERGQGLTTHRPIAVLDLGTGSGAIAISLALARPSWRVTATDCSPDALAQARRNASTLGAHAIRWRLGSWWQALKSKPAAPAVNESIAPTATAPPVEGSIAPTAAVAEINGSAECGPFADDGPFDLIVSNPPYLAQDDPHLNDPALRHEPQGALVSGPDGLEALKAIIEGAGPWLAPCGWLLLEHGYSQGEPVRECLARAGFTSVRTLPDLAGLDRVTLGQWGPSAPV